MSSRAKATQSRRPESKTDVRTAGRGATPPLQGQACKAFTRVASLPHQASGLYSSRNTAYARFVRLPIAEVLPSHNPEVVLFQHPP
jgi:hypothetical protein